jgi:hypothetical protein
MCSAHSMNGEESGSNRILVVTVKRKEISRMIKAFMGG